MGNLLDNAIEYTPSGGTVFLKGSMTEKSWQLTVFDQGPGFTKEALAHGTKRLWRGDTGRNLDGHRGLGLWIAAQVVKSHSGELELNNWERGRHGYNPDAVIPSFPVNAGKTGSLRSSRLLFFP